MRPALLAAARRIPASLALCVLGAAGHAGAQEPPWPVAGGDPVHSARAAGPAPPLAQAWTARLEGRGPVAGPVVTAAGVFVVGWDRVGVLAREDGSLIWDALREPGPAGPAAVAGVTVVYAEGGKDPALVAVLLADGTPVWRRKVSSPVVGGITAAGEKLYAGTRGGQVMALDAATGRSVWQADAPGRVETAPVATDRLVLVVAEDYDTGRVTVLALDVHEGKPEWRFVPDGVALGASAVTVSGDLAVAGLGDRHVYGLALSDGRQRWSTRMRAAFGARFVPAGGAGVILGDRLGHVYRLDPRTGEQLWLYRVPGDLLLGGPVVLDDRWVAVGDGSGEITVIDLETGHLAWRTDLGTRRVEALAADGDRLYAAERGGALRAFGPDPNGRLLDEPSPTTLFPLRAVRNWVVAAIPLFTGLVLLLRWIPSRPGGEGSEGARP